MAVASNRKGIQTMRGSGFRKRDVRQQSPQNPRFQPRVYDQWKKQGINNTSIQHKGVAACTFAFSFLCYYPFARRAHLATSFLFFCFATIQSVIN
jgi:hypothetical protein